MGRPKKSAPEPIEPEEETQEIPEEEEEVDEEADEETPGAALGATVSKAQAVREALAQGKEGPEEGTDYIRSQYGIEMSRQMFSSYKAQGKARQAKKGAAPKASAPRKAAPQAAPTPRATPVAPTGIIADIADIKRLLTAHGKDGLEELDQGFELGSSGKDAITKSLDPPGVVASASQAIKALCPKGGRNIHAQPLV